MKNSKVLANQHSELDKRTMSKIRTVKDWKNKTSMEVARKAHLTIEAVDITLARYGYLKLK
jgi:hypothetical protein